MKLSGQYHIVILTTAYRLEVSCVFALVTELKGKEFDQITKAEIKFRKIF